MQQLDIGSYKNKMYTKKDKFFIISFMTNDFSSKKVDGKSSDKK